MQRSGSQKALLVFSILELIAAGLCFLMGIMAVFAGGLLAGAGPEAIAEAGLTESDQALGAGLIGVLAVIVIVSALWSLLCGIFGIRAANDNQKIMVVWVFTLIGVILCVLSIIASIINGTFGQEVWSLVFTAVFDGIMFWLANNIKREAGK